MRYDQSRQHHARSTVGAIETSMAGSRPDGAWIVVNGARHPLAEHGSLLHLLQKLGLRPDAPAIAVAVNEQVIPRAEWAARRLQPGDRVEIVKPIQGG